MKYAILSFTALALTASACAHYVRINPSISIMTQGLPQTQAQKFQAAYAQRSTPWRLSQKLIHKMQAQKLTLDDLKPYSTEKFIRQLSTIKLVLNTFQTEIRTLGSEAYLNVNKKPQDYMLLQVREHDVRIFVNDLIKKDKKSYFFQFAYQAEAPYTNWKLVGLNFHYDT